MTDSADKLNQFDLSKPPLIIEKGATRESIEHITYAWQTWPEEVRYLIHRSGTKLRLDSWDSGEFIRDNTRDKAVELNTNTLPAWLPDLRDERQIMLRDLSYGIIMYDALMLAEPQLAKSLNWSAATREFHTSSPGKGASELLGSAYNRHLTWKRTGRPEVLNQQPRVYALWEQFHEKARELAAQYKSPPNAAEASTAPAIPANYPTCDIVTPDSVVVHFNLEVASVDETLSGSPPNSYDWSLYSLLPSEIENREVVKAKIQQAINRIQKGEYDTIIKGNQNAILDERTGQIVPPTGQKELLLSRLRECLEKDSALDEAIASFRQTVADAQKRLGKQPDAETVNKLSSTLRKDPSLLPANIDKVMQRERIPIVIKNDRQEFERSATSNSLWINSNATDNSIEATYQLMALSTLAYGALSEIPSLEINNSKLEALVPDYTKVKYAMERKRDEAGKYNSRLPRGSLGIALGTSEDKSRKLHPERDPSSHENDAIKNLANIQYLLNHYQSGPERDFILDRFQHPIAFHKVATDYINQRITECYPEHTPTPIVVEETPVAASPPPPPPAPPAAPGEEPESRDPRTPDELIARADHFARHELPDYHQLRASLLNTPEHPITLRLSNAQGDTHETRITTFEPNLDRALALKQQVQSHLLGIPGVVAYRSPMRNGEVNLQLDELIPAPLPRSNIRTKYGSYRIQMQWPSLKEEMSISLGIDHNDANRTEAQTRFDHANDYLAELRSHNAGATHLPITKGDLIDHMREWVAGRKQPWHDVQREPIEHLPAAIRLNFRGPNNDQDCWLHIDPLKPDGAPNFTWTQPVRFVVNGTQLIASAQINLHVRNQQVAERRAIETINELLKHLQQFSRPGGGFTLEDDCKHVRSLTIAERESSPHLLDANRLRDIFNHLRSPLNQDLEVRQVGNPVEENGMLKYTLGVFRGGSDGLAEHVAERNPTGGDPLYIARSFEVPVKDAGEFPKFLNAVNGSFTKDVHDKYDPRSNRNYNHAQQQVIQCPLDFNPGTAPKVLNDAIRTHLPDFPSFVPDRHYPRFRGPHGGSANGPVR